jgi:hypothetical protein
MGLVLWNCEEIEEHAEGKKWLPGVNVLGEKIYGKEVKRRPCEGLRHMKRRSLI